MAAAVPYRSEEGRAGTPSSIPSAQDEALELSAEALQRRVDSIGFGPAQIMALLCCGGIMASEGSEVNIMGSITTLLQAEWNLSGFMKGFMTSVVFMGFAFGNLLSGYVGDTFGRRPSILLSYFVIFLCGMLTSFTQSAFAMVCVRFFVGTGCGIGFPSVYSLVPEISPMSLRGVKSALLISFMPLGEFYASVGVFLLDPQLEGTTPLGVASWRTLVQWSCVPPLFFFLLSCAFLQESPHFLLSSGRTAELEATLERMAWLNGALDVPSSADPDHLFLKSLYVQRPAMRRKPSIVGVEEVTTWAGSVATLFDSSYVRTTGFLFLAHYTKDFAVFGLNYVFPQYFQQTAGRLSVGLEMMAISLLALPGVILATVLTRIDTIGHITSLSLTSSLVALMCFGLLDFLNIGACAYLVKFFAMAFFIVTVVYTAEVFPTKIRNTAVGLCTAMGRCGSIMSPLIFELLLKATGTFGPWWGMLMGLSFTVALLAPLLLELETKGLALAACNNEEAAPLSRRVRSRSSLSRQTSYNSTA